MKGNIKDIRTTFSSWGVNLARFHSSVSRFFLDHNETYLRQKKLEKVFILLGLPIFLGIIGIFLRLLFFQFDYPIISTMVVIKKTLFTASMLT